MININKFLWLIEFCFYDWYVFEVYHFLWVWVFYLKLWLVTTISPSCFIIKSHFALTKLNVTLFIPPGSILSSIVHISQTKPRIQIIHAMNVASMLIQILQGMLSPKALNTSLTIVRCHGGERKTKQKKKTLQHYNTMHNYVMEFY